MEIDPPFQALNGKIYAPGAREKNKNDNINPPTPSPLDPKSPSLASQNPANQNTAYDPQKTFMEKIYPHNQLTETPHIVTGDLNLKKAVKIQQCSLPKPSTTG